jgi:Neuraminidase (sialidase)
MNLPGKIVMELPPIAGNPRNSEGAFLNLNDGRLLFVYSRFNADSNEDYAPSCIAARTSTDGGITWDSQDQILFRRSDFDTLKEKCENIMSVSLLRMQDGALGLFFGIRYSFQNAKHHLFRSYDEGKNFEQGVLSVPGLGYYVTNNDRVIRTSTGRIIIPCNFHRMKYQNFSSENYKHYFDYRGISCFSISDDDGRTWREAKDCCFPTTTATNAGLQETGLVELQKGVIWAFSRTDLGCQYSSYSMDDGETWTTPQPSIFTSPCSPMSVKKASNGNLLSVWNPIPAYQTRGLNSYNFARTPLVAAVSRDNGASWSEPVTLEVAPGGYCYTAIHFEKEHVLLAYCAGNPVDESCLARLRMRRIPFSQLGL